MKKEQKKRTEIGCGADDLRVGTGRDADGTENGDINKDRELDMRIGMYAALDVLEPEDVEAFLSRIPEETWSEDRLENMVSDLEDNHACDGEEDRISVQKIRDRVQQQVSENLKENAENQAGEGITRQNFETVNRKKVKSNHFSWRRLAGAAAVAALALLVWQKDTVYAGLRRMLRLVPGVAVYEENEAAWYTVVPVNARFSWQGWIYELQEGYVERMPDQAGLTNRGRLVIRLTAQKDSVSAAESEQQASTGDPANMRENTQENTQQEVGLADASYFGDNRLYRRKKDSQDTWELLTDGGSGFGTEQTEDDEAGPKKIVIGKENLRMDDFSTEDEYCFGTAGGDGLIFTLREPSYEAILQARTEENASEAGTANEITANAEKSNLEKEIPGETDKKEDERISGADGIELRLAVTAEQTDDSLLISYYPYTGRTDMTMQIPYFPTYEILPACMDNGTDVRPWMSYGEEKVYAQAWREENDRYSDLVTTTFPVMQEKEGTLHVPYVQMKEQTDPITATLEDGQETKELGQTLSFARAQVRLERLRRITDAECETLLGEQLDGDTSAWLLELTVLQESDGWLLQKLSVQADRYPYSTVLPVFTDGKLTGMLLFFNDGNTYQEESSSKNSNKGSVTDYKITANAEPDMETDIESEEAPVTEFRRNAETRRTPAAIQLKIGSPSYLYHSDFVIGPIRK